MRGSPGGARFRRHAVALSTAFQSLPLSNFTGLGAAIPQNSALASVGADWLIMRDWRVTSKFDGEFASKSNIYVSFWPITDLSDDQRNVRSQGWSGRGDGHCTMSPFDPHRKSTT
jgi:hypothetical protein